MGRQGCSNKANQGPLDGCVSPPPATALRAKQSPAPKSVIYSRQHPLCCLHYAERQMCAFPSRRNKCILSILRHEYWHAHVYIGGTVLEPRRCFILSTSLKYFRSMDFDSNCSWFCSGLDLALSETILKPLWSMNTILANLHMDVKMCERINIQHV